jgi:hypothetical protein
MPNIDNPPVFTGDFCFIRTLSAPSALGLVSVLSGSFRGLDLPPDDINKAGGYHARGRVRIHTLPSKRTSTTSHPKHTKTGTGTRPDNRKDAKAQSEERGRPRPRVAAWW